MRPKKMSDKFIISEKSALGLTQIKSGDGDGSIFVTADLREAEMPRRRFPQFEDGEKATRETARRLNASAKFRTFAAEALARERQAVERSRILLNFARDPLDLARSPAPATPSRSKPKTKKEIRRTR